MASVLNQRALTRTATLTIFNFICRNINISAELSSELVQQIWEFNHPAPVPERAIPHFSNDSPAAHPALMPPATGRCMYMELPTELRRQIVAGFLPDKDAIIRPLCQKHTQTRNPKRKLRASRVTDLMLISRQFKEDIKACVYSERTFGIHVHEGIHDGGIEFLDTGRQPLHYKSSISDTRFARFDNGEFGFNALKHIVITIHPSTRSERFNSMTLYYINYALVRMLERSGEKDRIVSLTIQFAEAPAGTAHDAHSRTQIAQGEHAWWDLKTNQPRGNSLNGISDVELALRPFTMLTTVHDVKIYLPSKVNRHFASRKFMFDLTKSMKSNTLLGTLGPNDELEKHVEYMRQEVEDYIFRTMHGDKAVEGVNLTDQDFPMGEAEPEAGGESDEWDGLDKAIMESMQSANSNPTPRLGGVRSLYDEDEKNEDEDEESKPDPFSGYGHTLGGTRKSATFASSLVHSQEANSTEWAMLPPQKTSTGWTMPPPLKKSTGYSMERTMKEEHISTDAHGKKVTRVAWVDSPVHTPAQKPVPKATLSRGVSALDFDTLEVSESKATKTHPAASPGSSRPKSGEDTALQAASPATAFDLRSLAREGHDRRMAQLSAARTAARAARAPQGSMWD